MSAQESDYIVVSQVHLNRWYDDLQRAIPGWEVTVHDNVTGVNIPVFVSDAQYSVENVRTLVEQALEPIRGVHFLGR